MHDIPEPPLIVLAFAYGALLLVSTGAALLSFAEHIRQAKDA